MTSAIDPRLKELLRIVSERIETLGIDYAIGGALAMAAHGYRRHTSAVDLFVLEQDRQKKKVLSALREAGLQISAIMAPFHFIAVDPEHGDPDVRIDVLFPASEPDLSAIEFPERKPIYKGAPLLNVFEPSLLAMAKFYSDREEDWPDLRAMYFRGIFDDAVVRRMIGSVDLDSLEEWDLLLASFKKRRPPKKKPTARPNRES